MSVKTSNVFASLIKSTLGFSYGKPKRVGENSLTVVLPILRETTMKRQYLTFPETDKVHVFDTGKIDEMEADNQSGENVFIRSGTLFRGATQERALQRSMVLFPNPTTKTKMSVRCVHATRGISPGSKVTYGGITPLSFDSTNYGKGYKFGDQSSTWANVQNYTSSIGHKKSSNTPSEASHYMRSMNASAMWSASLKSNVEDFSEIPITSDGGGVGVNFMHTWQGSDDLASAMDGLSANLDEVLSKIKCEPTQAGLALITDSGVSTIEVFDHKDSWKALHESAVKRMGKELVTEDKESVFEYKPEQAAKVVNRVLALDYAQNVIYEHRPSNGEPAVKVLGLTGVGYVGEIVEINEQLIHLVLLKTA